MSLKTKYPNIFSNLQEDIDEVRKLVVVDVNYDDVDSDEFDVFDPSEYNYLIYVTERLQATLTEEKLLDFLQKLAEIESFENFYAHEKDMYGVQTSLDEDEIADIILQGIEKELVC